MDDDEEGQQPDDLESSIYPREPTADYAEWTTSPDQAAEEAKPYMPPIDPPVEPSRNQGAVVTAGLGVSAEDSPFRADAPTDDAWIAQEAERVLREDSGTSKLPLRVQVNDGTVYLYGYVSDEADTELAETAVSQVPGVNWVEDRTEVRPDIVDHCVVSPTIVEDDR